MRHYKSIIFLTVFASLLSTPLHPNPDDYSLPIESQQQKSSWINRIKRFLPAFMVLSIIGGSSYVYYKKKSHDPDDDQGGRRKPEKPDEKPEQDPLATLQQTNERGTFIEGVNTGYGSPTQVYLDLNEGTTVLSQSGKLILVSITTGKNYYLGVAEVLELPNNVLIYKLKGEPLTNFGDAKTVTKNKNTEEDIKSLIEKTKKFFERYDGKKEFIQIKYLFGMPAGFKLTWDPEQKTVTLKKPYQKQNVIFYCALPENYKYSSEMNLSTEDVQIKTSSGETKTVATIHYVDAIHKEGDFTTKQKILVFIELL